MNNIITHELIEKAYTYKSYKDLIAGLFGQNKTTGEKQSVDLVNYTKLNIERMHRIENTIDISDELKLELDKLRRPIIFLVIAEAWCGDVAQNLPIINKISGFSKNIELRIILRDENPDVMDRFLTNGGKAIPVCIILDSKSLTVIDKWGPRPAPAQEMMIEYKKNPTASRIEVIKRIQLRYNEDKGKTIQNEFLRIIGKLNSYKSAGF
jgi:hypothetical protein